MTASAVCTTLRSLVGSRFGAQRVMRSSTRNFLTELRPDDTQAPDLGACTQVKRA
jgi:hypothetical protein